MTSANRSKHLVTSLISLVAVLATSTVIARHVSLDVFGLYLFVVSCVCLGSLILTGALDVAILQHVPKYLGSKSAEQPEELRGFLRWVAQRFRRQGVVLLLVLALVVALAFGAAQIRGWPLSGQFDPLLIGVSMVLVGLLSCLALLRGFLQGLAAGWAMLPEQLLHPLLLLGLVAAGLQYSFLSTVPQLVGLSALASLLAIVGALFLLNRQGLKEVTPLFTSTPDSLVPNAELDSAQWSAGLKSAFVLAAAQLILGQGDVLVLGLLRGPTDTALYGAVVQLLLVFSFGFVAVHAAFASRYDLLFANADLVSIAQLSRWSLGLALGVALFLITALWLAAPWVLGLFGEVYVTENSLLVMRILLISQLALAVAVLVSYLLINAGRGKQVAVIAAMAAMVNLVLSLAFVSRLGMIGAAAATAVALVLQSITAWWFARRLGLI